MNYQQLVKHRLEVDTATNRIRNYLEQVHDQDEKSEREFRTSSARDSVNGTIALDLASLTFKVANMAKKQGDLEVANMLPKDIQNVIRIERERLSLTASGNRAFMASLARAEERKGLSSTDGQA